MTTKKAFTHREPLGTLKLFAPWEIITEPNQRGL